MKELRQPIIHGDWRPELKQSIDLTDLYVVMQIKRKIKLQLIINNSKG
jgi:hypothetical protein